MSEKKKKKQHEFACSSTQILKHLMCLISASLVLIRDLLRAHTHVPLFDGYLSPRITFFFFLPRLLPPPVLGENPTSEWEDGLEGI